MNKRIIFFGNERLISGLESTNAPILSGLIEKGYSVVAVVSHHSDSKSRNQRPLEVAEIAKNHNIPLYLPSKPSEIIDDIRSLQPDIAVLVAYGRIISQKVIDLFPSGIVNIHPSLLPKYRGPTPIESAILNGDEKTGVSIMQLSAGMDDGPVYAQKDIAMHNDTKQELYQKVVDTSTRLFFETFPSILDDALQPIAQININATYSQLIEKSDAIIDWNKTAIQLEREVRAYAAWPQSRTALAGIDVVITEASVTNEDALEPGQIHAEKSRLLIGTGSTPLEVLRIKPAGKKEMPIQAFLSGYKTQLER